ncbi:MAG: MlaD family protein [Acidobacteriota bacterium]
MNANSKRLMIGVFILGALVLALGAVFAFSSGLLFTKTMRCIMFFPNSVNGLQIGSPVLFRGVPLGSVKEISIEADAKGLNFNIPVVVELLGGKVQLTAPGTPGSLERLYQARKVSPGELLRQLIKKGLRAQLVTQSIVTGQLAISLNLLPDAPERLVGNTNLVEIQTVPSALEKFEKAIAQLPLQKLIDRFISATAGVENLFNSPEMIRMPHKFDAVLDSATATVVEIKAKVAPLADALEQALTSYSELAASLGQRSERLGLSAEKSFASFDAAMKDARSALGRFQKIMHADAPTITDLNRALNEIATAARAIRKFASFLERHPEALIQGKGGPGR